MTLSVVDGCFIGIVAISAVVGIFRGLIQEVLGLAVLALSAFVAWRFGVLLAPKLMMISSVPSMRLAAASLLLFIGCWLVCSMLTKLIVRWVRGAGLALPDRLLGAGFGALRGVAIAALVVMLAGMTPLKNDPWWQQSMFIPRLEWVAEELVKLAPADWRGKVNPSVRQQDT